jgi:hypothetical protein
MMHIKHSTTIFVIIGFAIITCAILCMNYYYLFFQSEFIISCNHLARMLSF